MSSIFLQQLIKEAQEVFDAEESAKRKLKNKKKHQRQSLKNKKGKRK